MKRLFDIIISLVALVLVSPLLLIISILVFVKLGRPVFFCQERPGLLGKPFTIFKFRTMDNVKDVAGNVLPDEQRMTKLGAKLRKYSLDELPQLFNVLIGDLSLIGPRPLLMEYLPLYSEVQAKRHDVRPGISGWAQVNGRNAVSWEEKFAYDVWYVENQSFFLDMKIIFMTVKKLIKPQGITQQGQATAEKFTGSSKHVKAMSEGDDQ